MATTKTVCKKYSMNAKKKKVNGDSDAENRTKKI